MPSAKAAAVFAMTNLALLTQAPAQERQTIEIRIENRRLISPEQTMRVTQGDQVELLYSSDETVELHLHGYDQTLSIQPDVSGVLLFEATETGRFPLSVHHWGEHAHGDDGGSGHDAMIYLEVYPQ